MARARYRQPRRGAAPRDVQLTPRVRFLIPSSFFFSSFVVDEGGSSYFWRGVVRVCTSGVNFSADGRVMRVGASVRI